MRVSLRFGGVVFVMQVVLVAFLSAQVAQLKGAADPLSLGKNALEHNDYDGAHKFFIDYVKENPKDTQAIILLGISEVQLKNFDAAIQRFQGVLKAKPQELSAHFGLVLAYSQKGDWPAFDKERASIKAARDSSKLARENEGGDLLDIVRVGDQRYIVKSAYLPVGPHHTYYVFMHVSDDGSVKDYFELDSDDGDQFVFKEQFPKEAAAGARRFSLDPFAATEGGEYVHHPMLRFYDGEPTYEELRADVIKVVTALQNATKGSK